MVSNPKKNQVVRVWYGRQARDRMPYHGYIGSVAVVCKGKPRNHGILLPSVPGKNSRAEVIAIPCGNIEPLETCANHAIHTRRAKGGWMASVVMFRSWRPGDFTGDQFIAGDLLCVRQEGVWRSVLGVSATREAAIDLAKASVDMQGCRPLNPVPDARDRRRSLWWHREAKRRRESAASATEARP